MKVSVPRVDDFILDGAGASAAWELAEWMAVGPVLGPGVYATRAKVVYSATGIYGLFDCEDRTLTSTGLKDNDDLWTEDVVEAFFWTDVRQPIYFEYEISPLGADLQLLVPNHNGTFMGWLPWHTEGARQVRKATAVRGESQSPGASITGWSAEFFIPFALFKGLGNTPPVAGTQWRGNFYRIDHDDGVETRYAWAGDVGNDFHTYRQFGTLIFQ
jgi:hypothetical protein